MAGVAVSLMAATATRSDQRKTMDSTEDDQEEVKITIHHCFDSSQASTDSESNETVEITIVPVQESESRERGILSKKQCAKDGGRHGRTMAHARCCHERGVEIPRVGDCTIENLGLKLDSMETEFRRAMDRWNNLLQAEAAKLEIKSLKKKLRRLRRANSRSLWMICRQAATSRLIESQKEQEKQELKDMVVEPRSIIDQMEENNKELHKKLKVGETKMPVVEKIQSELDKLVVQVEQLQKERISELEELIYLRWINACLSYEIFRSIQEQAKTEKTKERLPFTREFYQEEAEKKVVCDMGHEWASLVDMNTSNMSGAWKLYKTSAVSEVEDEGEMQEATIIRL